MLFFLLGLLLFIYLIIPKTEYVEITKEDLMKAEKALKECMEKNNIIQ